MAKGNYRIVSGEVGQPIKAVWDDGTVEPAFENVFGPHAGTGTPYLIPKSLVSQFQGASGLNSNDPFASTFGVTSSYVPAIFRKSKESFVDKYAIPAFMAGLGGTALMGGGGAVEGGTGVDALVGDAGADTLASSEFTGGLSGSSLGSPGFSGAVTGAPGMAATGASGALSPGFFGSEFASPILGGAAAGATGSALGGAATGGAASSILSNPALLGGALGAGASLLGGNSPAGSTTSEEDIPAWLKPYAIQGMQGLSDAYKATPTGVNPLTAQGGGYLSAVIGGDYLNNNPYLDAMFDRAAGKVSAGVNSQFSSAGRYGSGAHQGVLGESLGNLATDIYGGNYTRERANQQAAALGAGAYGNTMIDQPFRAGQNLLSGVGSIRGGTRTTPYFQNQLGDALSGAFGGALLGKMFA